MPDLVFFRLEFYYVFVIIEPRTLKFALLQSLVQK